MASDLTKLIKLLKEDSKTLSELEQLLQTERQCLEENALDRLDTINHQKHPLLVHMEANGRARREWLHESKLPLPRFLDLLAAKAPPVMDLYRQCESKLQQVHKLNEVNGRILATSQLRVTKLLSIIRGQHKHNHIYGKNGSEKAVGYSHVLAQA